MLDSPIVLVTLCYYGLSKNELPIFIKSEKLLKIFNRLPGRAMNLRFALYHSSERFAFFLRCRA